MNAALEHTDMTVTKRELEQVPAQKFKRRYKYGHTPAWSFIASAMTLTLPA